MKLTDAQTIALTAMAQHGLTVKGWKFKFDRAVKRFGSCRYRTKTITLSAPLVAVNDRAEVTNTVLHEIAHALAGHKAGHGPVWKAMAKSIGCDGNRCYDSNKVTAVPTTVRSQYVAHCPSCNKEFRRVKRVSAGQSHSCSACSGGRYNPAYKLTWKMAA